MTQTTVTENNLFAQMLDAYDYNQPAVGETVVGEVIYEQEGMLFVDIGANKDAVIPYQEVLEIGHDFLEKVEIGDEIPVTVKQTGMELEVSYLEALKNQDWRQARKAAERERLLELPVVGQNKGGLLVQFENLTGFVPNSHLPILKTAPTVAQRRSIKSKLLGTTIPVTVLEVNAQRDRLIMSAKNVQNDAWREAFDNLEVGQKVTGRVEGLANFGAFVRFGLLEGLLHISEIAWQHINSPKDVLAIGDEVEVIVNEIDRDRERISLSRKALLPNPYETFDAENNIGDLVTGEVNNVVDFGAFVRFDVGVQGLIHVSEMDGDPRDCFVDGEEVMVRIQSIDTARERIGLSVIGLQ